jgi:transposase-like protein
VENYSPDAYGDPEDKEEDKAEEASSEAVANPCHTPEPSEAEIAAWAQATAKQDEQDSRVQGKVRVFVKDIAARCGVEEATVTKWIRTNAIPAQKIGKRWFVRECDLGIFIANGGKMPPDYLPIENPTELDLDPDPVNLDSRPGMMRPIMPFAAYESAKTGWTPIRGTKFPPEWGPRIARIVEKIPNYQESTGNFIRDAVFCRILDIETMIAESGGISEENWKIYTSSQQIIEQKLANDRCIESLKKAAAILRELKNKSEWDKFYSENIALARALPQPWKKRAIEILKNKQKETGEI